MSIKYYFFIVTLLIFISCGTSKKISDKDGYINKSNPSEKGISNKSQSEINQEALFVEACRMRILGENEQAVNLLNQCLFKNPENDAVLYEVASIYLDTKEFNKALQYILPAIKINPTNKWYKILGSDIYESLGKYKEGADLFLELSNQFPEQAEYQYDRAYFLSKAGEYEKAIEALNGVQKKVGISEDLAVEKQKLWLKLNKPEKAIDEIVEVKNAFPTDPRYSAMLADLYLANGMNEKAFACIQDLAKQDSTNIQAQTAVAEYYLKQNQFDLAFPYLKKIFSNPAVNIDYKVKTMVSYFKLVVSNEARKKEAIELGNILINTNSDNAKSYAVCGDLYSQLNLNRVALNYYNKAVMIDESKFALWQQILLIQSQLDIKDSLLLNSDKVVELFPDQPLAFYYSGIARVQSKEYSKAIKSFDRVLLMGSEDKGLISQIYASVGDCYFFINNNRASDSCYEMSLSFDPDNIYTLNNYAFRLATRGERLDEAALMSGKVINVLAPNISNYIDTYAWILYKQKKYTDAKLFMDKVIKSGNINNANFLEHYGDILYQLNDIDNALIYWNKAKEAGADKLKIEKKINDKKIYE